MKIKHLLAVALMAIGCSAWAQSYTEGVEVAAGTDYFLMNVESSKFLTDGMDWGTHATVDNAGRVITFELNDGKYAIKTKTYVNNEKIGYMTDNGYLDTGGAQYWQFEPTTVDGYTNAYIIKQADDKVLHFNAADCRVNVGTASGNAAAWIIVPMSVRQAAKDYTYLMQNTDFNRPWERKNWSGTEAAVGGLETNRVGEMFNKTFDMNQTITGVPNGKWKLTCQGFYRAGNKDNNDATTKNAKLYINNTEGDMMNVLEGATAQNTTGWDFQNAAGYIPDHLNEVSTHFLKGDFSSNEVIAVVSDGKLKLGVKKSTTIADDWTTFDNFKLYYLGEDLSDYEQAYQTACTNALAIDQTKPMNSAVKEALASAISTYANKTYTTVETIRQAITALETATTNATNSIKQYEDAVPALAAQKALMDGTNVYEATGFEAYQTKWTTLSTKLESKTLTNEDAVVNPTVPTGWHSSTDYNFLLTPWTIGGEVCDKFDKGLYINTWSTEGNTDGSNFTVPFFEYWGADGESLGNNTIATSVNTLPNGLYSVTTLVRVRAKNGVTATDATGVTLSVNDGTAVDATEGAQIGTSQFTIAEVTAEGIVKDGKLNINLAVKDANISWLAFKNVKYTKVRDLTPEEEMVLATAEDIAALNAAIEAAEAKTIGFLAGEYATYNNAAAIKSLAAAKAINTSVSIDQETVLNATEALTSATWTVNSEELNAVYDGGFSKTTTQSGGYLVPTGWTNVGYNTRVYNQTNKGSNNGVDAGSEGGCLFAKFTTTYGEVEGYEMPLKKGFYSLSFIYGGWNEIGTREIKVYNTENDATVTPGSVTAKNNQAHVSTDAWSSYNGVIEIPADGNYILSFYRQSTTSQNQIAISDIKIFSLGNASAPIAVGDAGYATFVAPFEVAVPAGVKAYIVEGTGNDGATLTLNEVETTIAANTPVVLEGTLTATTVYGKEVTGDPKAGVLTGVYEDTTAPVGSYVLQKHGEVVGFFLVGETIPTVPANRAYLTVSGSDARFFGFGDETAINAIDALTTGKAEIFDLSGRRLNNLQKGINVVNGVKILVK